jgi:hypothetical protein
MRYPIWKPGMHSPSRITLSLLISNRSLRQLNTVDGRKMQILYRWDRDCHDTVVWLRNNQHRFQQPILEPPLLSVTVDQRFVDGVESCFGGLSMRVGVYFGSYWKDILSTSVDVRRAMPGGLRLVQ